MNNQKQIHTQQLSETDNTTGQSSYTKIAKGSLVSFVGAMSAAFLIFLTKMIITKNYSQSDYGIFSLSLIILNICAVVGGLGLLNGASRNIAYYKAKGLLRKTDQIIAASLKISLFVSIAFMLVLFFLTELMATTVFKDPRLIEPFHVIAFCIPLLVLSNTLVAIFRGMGNVKVRAYFTNITPNIFFVIILLAIVLLGKPFSNIFYGYWLSFFATFSLLLGYTAKKLRLSVPIGELIRHTNVNIIKELLIFSLPLLVISVAQMVMLWTDSLMLQYYKGTEIVGLYNVACPLARFLYIPMSATLLIYVPVTSRLYAQRDLEQIKKVFSMVVKWVFIGAFPVFVILFFSSTTVLTDLFTSRYINASQPLKILLIGFLVINLLGPNGATLLAMGNTKFLMKTSMIALICNIALNILLIPRWGVSGAATATTTGLVLQAVIRHITVSANLKFTPFTKNIIILIAASVVIFPITLYLFKCVFDDSIWLLAVFVIFEYIVLAAAIFVTGSLEKAEKEALLSIIKKLGLTFPLKKTK